LVTKPQIACDWQAELGDLSLNCRCEYDNERICVPKAGNLTMFLNFGMFQEIWSEGEAIAMNLPAQV